MAGHVMNTIVRRDMEFGGPYKIIELVTLINVPVIRKVRLCDQRTGLLVRESLSNAEGYIIFNYIQQGPWILYALDHNNEFQSVMISNRLATINGYRL